MKSKLAVLCLSVLAIFLFFPTGLEASALQKIVRSAGKVADDVPLRPMEESISSPATRQMAQDLMQKTKNLDGLPYSRALVREIKAVSGQLDPAVLKALDTLDEAGLEVVMLASRGAKNIETVVPDVLRRGELLRKVDADTLCVLGRFDDLAKEADYFQSALINPKNIPSPDGMRRVTLDDFGAFFKKFGEKGHDFWMNTVKPNWKWWAGGTALAAILLTPEEDLDKAIESVGWAAHKVVHTGGKIVEVGGEVVSDATETIIETTGDTVGEMILAVLKGFFSTWLGTCIAIIGGLLLLLYILSNQFVQAFFRQIGKMFVSIKNFIYPNRS